MPIFEADLEPEQYGYRPGRSAKDAVEADTPLGEHMAATKWSMRTSPTTSVRYRTPS